MISKVYADADVPTILETQDATADEFGMRFTASKDGWILGVRFYRGAAANQGPHYGKLWDAASQAMLGFSEPSNDAASLGWQSMFFSLPLRVIAGRQYVASYNTNAGHFAYTPTVESLPTVVGGSLVHHGAYHGLPNTFPATLMPHDYFVDVLYTTESPQVPMTYIRSGVLSIAPGLPNSDPNDPMAGQLAVPSIIIPEGWDFLLYDLHFVGKRVIYGGNDRNSYMHLIHPNGMVTVTDQGDKLSLQVPVIYAGPTTIVWGFGNGGPEVYNVSGMAGGLLVPHNSWRGFTLG